MPTGGGQGDQAVQEHRNPGNLKKLEYQDFKFDVLLKGATTFKIMFEPGVLPEEFPQTRERRTRRPLAQGAQPQEAAPAAEPQPQDEQAAEALPLSVAEAFAQVLEDAQAAGEPVADIAAAMAAGEAIKAEIIEDEGEGQLIVITAEPKATEAIPEPVETTAEVEAQLEDREPAKKSARKGKDKKGAVVTDNAEK